MSLPVIVARTTLEDFDRLGDDEEAHELVLSGDGQRVFKLL
jgi:hypothetical protein